MRRMVAGAVKKGELALRSQETSLHPVRASRNALVVCLAAIAIAFASGCGSGGKEMWFAEELSCPVYDDSAAAMPRLLYEDGSLTLNDRCMVRSSKLNPKIRAIYVNGRPLGFC